ncbi:MAG: phosphotransferase [Bdellovibrionota bacterium]
MKTENQIHISQYLTQEIEGSVIMPKSFNRTGVLPPPPVNELCHSLNTPSLKIEWLAGDGSDRCYYRLHPSNSDSSLVLMQLSGRDAVALEKGGYEWIELAKILQDYNILTPKVIATLPDYAAIIIEDYGNMMLSSLLQTESGFNYEVAAKYQLAIDIIINFLSINKNKKQVWCSRSFDKERFEWELDFFYQKFLAPIASLDLNKSQLKIFRQESQSLAAYLAKFSKYFVHRDFHSRNLMVSENNIAVIDFQDARLGPPSYDLVSLIFDSYVPIDNSDRLDLLEYAISSIRKKLPFATVQNNLITDEISNSWKPTLLQRQLKAIGSFGFLTLEKNRGDYLKYVKPALTTLIQNDIYDKRWPYISGELVENIMVNVDASIIGALY